MFCSCVAAQGPYKLAEAEREREIIECSTMRNPQSAERKRAGTVSKLGRKLTEFFAKKALKTDDKMDGIQKMERKAKENCQGMKLPD